MREKNCASCRYYQEKVRLSEPKGGLCMRYPPTPMLMPSPGPISSLMGPATPQPVGMAGVNPPVNPEHTCGEFRKLADGGHDRRSPTD